MTRPGDQEDRQHQIGGTLIPFPGRRSPAGEVHETELADLVEAGGSGDVGTSDASPPPGNELEKARPVLDAELVDDDQDGAPSAAGGLARPVVVVRQLVQPVIVVVQSVRQSENAARVTKVVLRNLMYVVTGVLVVTRRRWDQSTGGLYQRQIQAAEAAGDKDALRDWEHRAEQAAERRHKRRMDLLLLPWRLARALAVIALVAPVMLVLIGLAVAVSNQDLSTVMDPLLATVALVGLLVNLVLWLANWLVITSPALVISWLWLVGRRTGVSRSWLQVDPLDGRATALVTADGIVRALQHLGIPKLDKAFKGGWVPPFELPPTREGQGAFRGYRAIFGLPEGVTPTMVADRRDVLAANLGRNGMEVWPADYGQEKGGRARFVNMYVADSGVMDKPTPTYPLLHEGTADVFRGVPVGITQRGDSVLMPLNGSNCIFGGLPGQGKSNGVRVLFAGAALDPLAELRVHVFAGNGDFDAYERRLSRYQKGATPKHAAAATLHLEELLAEVERREQRLAELGAKKLTRPIAQQHPDMRPLVVGFSECHELFGDKEHGDLAADLAIRVVKRGRKTGVITVFDTQSSRASAIPSQLVENMGVNCCFSVKTWRNNDGFLGDGSFAAGIRATELRFNVDRGTMIATGLTDELFEIVRMYFIEVNDDTGWDAATEIIDRAMGHLDPDTSTSRARPAPELEPVRDLLADVAEVLGTEHVRAADVPALLARAFARHRPYQRLTGKELVQLLADLGVKVPSTGNRWPVNPEAVRKALSQRGS